MMRSKVEREVGSGGDTRRVDNQGCCGWTWGAERTVARARLRQGYMNREEDIKKETDLETNRVKYNVSHTLSLSLFLSHSHWLRAKHRQTRAHL